LISRLMLQQQGALRHGVMTGSNRALLGTAIPPRRNVQATRSMVQTRVAEEESEQPLFSEVDQEEFDKLPNSKIILLGRMGKDPVQKPLRSDYILHTTTLAVNDSRPGKQKTIREETEDLTVWFDINFWGEAWRGTLQDFKKGSWTGVSGALSLRKFEHKNGDPGLRFDVNATSISHVHAKDDPRYAESTEN